MEDCVDIYRAYLHKLSNKWITQELFYEWLIHKYNTSDCLVCLLVDGHISHVHIDLETPNFCKENDTMFYCLPAHITQPLDVLLKSKYHCQCFQ